MYTAGIDVLDTNKDGLISEEEFSSVCRAPFDMLDKDRDGMLSRASAYYLFKRLCFMSLNRHF